MWVQDQLGLPIRILSQKNEKEKKNKKLGNGEMAQSLGSLEPEFNSQYSCWVDQEYL